MAGSSETGQIVIGTASGLSTVLLAYLAATVRRAAGKFMGEHKYLLDRAEKHDAVITDLLTSSKESSDAVVTIARDIDHRQELADIEHARMQEEIDAVKRRRR